MEEQKVKKKTFTEKEVMELISKMQSDYNAKMQECTKAMNEINGTLTRLNFLLKIVSIKDIFSPEFITKCALEIEDIVTLPEDSNNKE